MAKIFITMITALASVYNEKISKFFQAKRAVGVSEYHSLKKIKEFDYKGPI